MPEMIVNLPTKPEEFKTAEEKILQVYCHCGEIMNKIDANDINPLGFVICDAVIKDDGTRCNKKINGKIQMYHCINEKFHGNKDQCYNYCLSCAAKIFDGYKPKKWHSNRIGSITGIPFTHISNNDNPINEISYGENRYYEDYSIVLRSIAWNDKDNPNSQEIKIGQPPNKIYRLNTIFTNNIKEYFNKIDVYYGGDKDAIRGLIFYTNEGKSYEIGFQYSTKESSGKKKKCGKKQQLCHQIVIMHYMVFKVVILL